MWAISISMYTIRYVKVSYAMEYCMYFFHSYNEVFREITMKSSCSVGLYYLLCEGICSYI